MAATKKALGRGLNSLMNSNNIAEQANDANKSSDDSANVAINDNNGQNNILEIDINKITPNKNQPRTKFDEDKLKELADSIKEVGVLQPITVNNKGEFYYIIAGERRWRAARIAGLKTIPVYVRDMDELKVHEASLIENIQREDLDPIEEALAYKKFSDEFSLSQEQIAQKVGKSRVTVTNSLRLLNLDDRVQNFVKEGKISGGHARTLLGLKNADEQFEIAEKIIDEGFSVRQTEELIKNINNKIVVNENDNTKNNKTNPEIARACLDLSKDLKSMLGTKVRVQYNGKDKGKIEIEYYSLDDLDRIVGIIKGKL